MVINAASHRLTLAPFSNQIRSLDVAEKDLSGQQMGGFLKIAELANSYRKSEFGERETSDLVKFSAKTFFILDYEVAEKNFEARYVMAERRSNGAFSRGLDFIEEVLRSPRVSKFALETKIELLANAATIGLGSTETVAGIALQVAEEIGSRLKWKTHILVPAARALALTAAGLTGSERPEAPNNLGRLLIAVSKLEPTYITSLNNAKPISKIDNIELEHNVHDLHLMGAKVRSLLSLIDSGDLMKTADRPSLPAGDTLNVVLPAGTKLNLHFEDDKKSPTGLDVTVKKEKDGSWNVDSGEMHIHVERSSEKTVEPPATPVSPLLSASMGTFSLPQGNPLSVSSTPLSVEPAKEQSTSVASDGEVSIRGASLPTQIAGQIQSPETAAPAPTVRPRVVREVLSQREVEARNAMKAIKNTKTLVEFLVQKAPTPELKNAAIAQNEQHFLVNQLSKLDPETFVKFVKALGTVSDIEALGERNSNKFYSAAAATVKAAPQNEAIQLIEVLSKGKIFEPRLAEAAFDIVQDTKLSVTTRELVVTSLEYLAEHAGQFSLRALNIPAVDLKNMAENLAGCDSLLCFGKNDSFEPTSAFRVGEALLALKPSAAKAYFDLSATDVNFDAVGYNEDQIARAQKWVARAALLANQMNIGVFGISPAK